MPASSRGSGRSRKHASVLAAGAGAAADHSALADVPRALPALTRAAKLGQRAARVGFDWETPRRCATKCWRRCARSRRRWRRAPGKPEKVAEEVGDLLFAVANWGLHLKIDPEAALRAANAKFERRFRRMEALSAAQGTRLQALDAAQWDALWRQAKREV